MSKLGYKTNIDIKTALSLSLFKEILKLGTTNEHVVLKCAQRPENTHSLQLFIKDHNGHTIFTGKRKTLINDESLRFKEC